MAHVLSYRETVNLIRDFLEVAFHTLLYIRNVYPESLFRKVKKYNIEVFQSRNPALTEYIGHVLECVEEEMQKGAVRRVILVIKEGNMEEKPLERFVFDFEWLIHERDVPRQGDDWTPAEHGLAQGDIEDLLRACFRKMYVSQTHLKRLQGDLSFAVVIEMKDDAAPPQSKAAREGNVPTEWVPAEQRHALEDDGKGPGRGTKPEDYSSISALETVRLGMISMDIRVEETAEKFAVDELMSSAEDGAGGGVRIHKLPDRKGKGRA
ncbi:hypothetical protein JCM6882_008083 [Rhodosporidiobolus microsporus]